MLVNHGPLSVLLNAELLQFYHSGVYDPIFCDPSALDHAVLLVGYGVSSGLFGKKPYWLVKVVYVHCIFRGMGWDGGAILRVLCVGCLCACLFVCACMYLCLRVCLCICVYVVMYVVMHVYLHVYMCSCVYMPHLYM